MTDKNMQNNKQEGSKILDSNDNLPFSQVSSDNDNQQTQTSIIAHPPKIYTPSDTNELANTNSKKKSWFNISSNEKQPIKTTNSKISTIIVIEDPDLTKECKAHGETTTKQDNENLSISEESIIENDPRNWSAGRKRLILFLIAFAGLISPIVCTIYFPAINDVRKNLNTSEVLANSSRSIWFLLVMRAFQASGASAAMSIGAGVITDVFRIEERGTAYGIFFVGPLIGPLIGPVIGGYLDEYLGWRWIFWMLAIIGFVILLIIFFCLPETFRQQSTIPKKRFNPFTPLLLLRYPFVSIIVAYVSAVCVPIFILQTLVSTSIAMQYNLSSANIGLVLIANGIGLIIGSVLGGKYSDCVLRRAKKKYCEEYPEMRIQSLWLGAVMFLAGMLAFGWLVQANLALVWVLVAMFIGAIGMMLVFSATATYLVDALPTQSASAIAVYHCMRLIISAITSVIAQPLDSAIGTGWTFTIPSIICIFCTALVALIPHYGRQWRKNMLTVET
ncbi:8231_t:CDS:2 [Ambispora leptoticha]|uniref:8231_t:CDS:1 n=1 Tax=Ambispora leptoticha TaxID=144679 RepID=A0A9N8WSI3_9GLOM|nr:8231_t:CDS:2 [Ambispora leptoticha]